jgi:hypothetical protein
MKGQGREKKGGSDDDKWYQQQAQRCRFPIVDSHLLGRVLATAKTQLRDPPGFLFAVMPPKCTPQKSESKKKLEAASARKTRAQLAAKTADSGEICSDRLMEATKTAEEGSQIQPEGRGGHAEVEAQTGATRDAATAHSISDDQESRIPQESRQAKD